LPCALVAAVFIAGCEEEQHSYVPNIDSISTPTMVTTHVSTLISDSGYTRYNITTKIWNIFDESAEPYWTFPEGLKLVQYDRKMKPDANLRCDSAIYYSNRRMWRLDGDVVMVNVMRDSFLTQQLYWDQAKAEVYSDSFIHIVRSNHIIEGYGFTSNENMTAYTVHKPTAIIPLDKNKNGGKNGTVQASPERTGERPAAPLPASQRTGTAFNPFVTATDNNTVNN
jgi:LPS export ABC transporter protein LptC